MVAEGGCKTSAEENKIQETRLKLERKPLYIRNY